MRGFLGGLVVGLGLSGVTAGAVSLVMPLPDRPDVDTSVANAPGAPAGSTQPVSPDGTDADLVEALPTAPEPESSQPDADPETADLSPASKPDVGTATNALRDPNEGETPTVTTPDVENSASPVGQDVSDAPRSPDPDSEPSISVDPTQPPIPTLAQDGSGFSQRPPVEQNAPEVDAQTDAEVTDSEAVAVLKPRRETVPTGDPSLSQAPRAEAAPSAQPSPTDQPGLPQIGGTGASPDVPPSTVPTRPGEVASEVIPEADAQSATLEQADTAPSPSIGTPVVPLIDRTADQPVAAQKSANPPLRTFAVPFENPDKRPLMSIVLVDDENAIGVEALRDFPYPVTLALNPSDPMAPQKMAAHRAAGFETVMIADLDPAATPQDAETAFEVWQAALPETVAILEGQRTGFQGNRALSDQVTTIADTSGRGLVTVSNGLNTVQKLAAREGIPSAVVFRDFDGAGQTPTIMRRFLDQAAFRARQEGGVIMLGRVQPDTISALVLWGLQDRAQRVALAPISAILMQEPSEE